MVDSLVEGPVLAGPERAAEARSANLFLIVAALGAAAGLGLSVTLHFPEVLLDPRPVGTALVRSGLVGVVLSLLALVAAGVALIRLAGGRRAGQAAGLCWVASGLLGLVLVPLWRTDAVAAVPLGVVVFVGFAIAAPALAAVWTVGLLRHGRILGVAGIVGLVVTAIRSVVWLVDLRLSPEDGFYVTSSVLTVAALLGYPLWLCWLLRVGWALRRPGRRRWGTAVAGVVVVVVHAFVVLVGTPTPDTDALPVVPSAAAALRYTVMLGGGFAGSTSYPELQAARQDDDFTRPRYPAGTTVRNVDAGGVPAEYLCARGATTDRVALYLPGGGFIMPPGNAVRAWASEISRQTRACILMVHYRLAPEHAYPAAMQDGVAAYRWLRQQGVPASRMAIFGDSAGGNLTLTTALSLRKSGDPLPAALVPVSGVTDFTLTGPTIRSKEYAEGLLTRPHRDYVERSYVAGADPRDPLLSPLYADPTGLPPTLLMVGSQEVMLSDMTRMADRMRAANVPVTLEVWRGMPHSWNSAAKPTMETRLATKHLADFLTRHFG